MNLFDVQSPYVRRVASIERARRENDSGEFSGRLARVLALVDDADERGATWRELSTAMGLHHGQVSAALSTLHAKGYVCALVERRNRCHPYVSMRVADRLDDAQIIRQPVKTRARADRDRLTHLEDTVAEFRDGRLSTHETLSRLIRIIDGDSR